MVSQEEREQRQKEQLDANQKAFEQQEKEKLNQKIETGFNSMFSI
jgi:hypothetical protein